MSRRELAESAKIAHELSMVAHENCNGRCQHDVGLKLMAAIEKHYGSRPIPPSDGTYTLDRLYVESLWKMAVERDNINSSFPQMCKLALDQDEMITTLRQEKAALEAENQRLRAERGKGGES